MKEILARIKKVREEKEYSQKQAAELMGISQSFYSEVERGVKKCDTNFISTFCKNFKVSKKYLEGFTEDQQEEIELVEDAPAVYQKHRGVRKMKHIEDLKDMLHTLKNELEIKNSQISSLTNVLNKLSERL